ncbi:hypothetical protein [Chitinophaga sp. Cy-1792]|uniref:hypothetical protein n=1 Tax=Chitinophaga sp. Cy-1792 TaxID=2608339 RepID=UPI0014248340|nr:hypothetical protein [Chitinophaga sp. Cy-1792]NIG54042.1 hypothetical protein [Chitinophaga sp. Cy-1792]
MNRCLLLLSSILFFFLDSHAQQTVIGRSLPSQPDTLNVPEYYMDGVKYPSIEAMKVEPNDLCEFRIEKKPGSQILYGTGPDSCKMVILITRPYARQQAWENISALSPAYSKVVPTAAQALNVVYIVNGKLESGTCLNAPREVNKKNLISISIINKDKLQKKYGVMDKDHGVIIKYRKNAATRH